MKIDYEDEDDDEDEDEATTAGSSGAEKSPKLNGRGARVRGEYAKGRGWQDTLTH